MGKKLDERRSDFFNALSRLGEALEKDIKDVYLSEFNKLKTFLEC